MFADLLDPPENPYVRDPVGWVTESLGECWWSGQRRMAQSVVENRYSAFKAAHDVSKSHTMSRLALWWIKVHPPGEAFVVTTAPTTPQVEAILWRYMGNAHKKAGLAGRITLQHLDHADARGRCARVHGGGEGPHSDPAVPADASQLGVAGFTPGPGG